MPKETIKVTWNERLLVIMTFASLVDALLSWEEAVAVVEEEEEDEKKEQETQEEEWPGGEGGKCRRDVCLCLSLPCNIKAVYIRQPALCIHPKLYYHALQSCDAEPNPHGTTTTTTTITTIP